MTSSISGILQQMMVVTTHWIFVLDMGYDAEWVHQMIRQNHMLSMIPVRSNSRSDRTCGRYRKQMRREFDGSSYCQRNKCETIFSVIKRKFGSEIRSHHDTMKEKDLLYRVLAYNCHRMCVISALLWMISS